MTEKRYDVVIVGGGCIGSSIAYFLKNEKSFTGSVLVIERDPTYEFCSTTRVPAGSVSELNETVVGSICAATSTNFSSLRPDLSGNCLSWRMTA